MRVELEKARQRRAATEASRQQSVTRLVDGIRLWKDSSSVEGGVVPEEEPEQSKWGLWWS